MNEGYKDQRNLWEAQHEDRKDESRQLEGTPNLFAKRCVELLPDDALVLEVGAANGRDARFFAREKNARVMATDFAFSAMHQLKEASERDGTADKVAPIVADVRALPLNEPNSIDAVYSRSALHITDEELDNFFNECTRLLKNDGLIMIEGKTEEDPKIVASKETSPHLYKNGSSHLRRLWNESIINDLIAKHSLLLVEMNKTTEVWNQIETKFINFIAQKQQSDDPRT